MVMFLFQTPATYSHNWPYYSPLPLQHNLPSYWYALLYLRTTLVYQRVIYKAEYKTISCPTGSSKCSRTTAMCFTSYDVRTSYYTLSLLTYVRTSYVRKTKSRSTIWVTISSVLRSYPSTKISKFTSSRKHTVAIFLLCFFMSLLTFCFKRKILSSEPSL